LERVSCGEHLVIGDIDWQSEHEVAALADEMPLQALSFMQRNVALPTLDLF